MDMDISKWDLAIKAVHVPTGVEAGLKWRVQLLHKGREVLATDFSAGIGYCPSYRAGDFSQTHSDQAHSDLIRAECATGRPHRWHEGAARPVRGPDPILPKPSDVLYALLYDAAALDFPNFESWASDFGYDPDSRKAEATYRKCLDTGLRMRAMLGEALMAELREAFQDY